MVSSARQAITCILLIFGTAVSSQSQTNPAKDSTASISGKVTLKGKGVPGIVVIAMDNNSSGGLERASHRTTTDISGNYRISNLPAGTYRVTPYVLAFALEKEQATNPFIVAEGEALEDVNLALVRGGVITGKITDSEGQPLIEEFVSLTPVDDQFGNMWLHRGIQTDDRGIYRAFGLPQGKYKVAAGQPDRQLPGGSRLSYRQTFHPSTTDAAKATVIEVTEGSETTNIDIVMAARAPGGFKVSGRIVDGESGKPLADIMYGISQKVGEHGSHSTSGARSNTNGEFQFENVLPGKYAVFIETVRNSEMRANPVSFEVTDRDVAGLLIKTVKGASLSGVVVLEGTDERPVSKKPGELQMYAWVETPDRQEDSYTGSSASINADGGFKINGLRSGIAHIQFASTNRNGGSDFGIVRIERDGVPQPSGINIKDGEQVDGLRVVVKHFTGAIRGQVKFEGELPPSSRPFCSVKLLDDNLSNSTSSHRSTELDSRGRFFVEGLAAGRYEVLVTVFMPGVRPTDAKAKQEVTVTDNAVSDVSLTVKLKANP